MKASSLLQHIGIALLLTFLAVLNDFILGQFLTELLSVKLNIVSSIFLYLIYILWQSSIAAGRISLFVIDLGVLLVSLYASLSSVNLLFMGLFLIWINRLLLCYSSVLAVIAGLGLCLFSAALVYWLIFNGHSMITTLWCLFLLQSLHCMMADKGGLDKAKTSVNNNFDQALQSAENALQQLVK